jgi:hypothetical protein
MISRFHTGEKGYPKLLMFQDSFGERLNPYLSESFSESLYIWTPGVSLAIIEKEKPHVVILELVERHLSSLLPNRWDQ